MENDINNELDVVEVKIGEYKKIRRRHHRSKTDDKSSSKSKSAPQDGEHHSHSRKSSRKRHRSHKKRKRVIKRILIAAASVVLSLVLIATGVFIYLRETGKRELTESAGTIAAPENLPVTAADDGNTIKYNGKTYKYKQDAVNILFMGVDDYGTDEGEAEIGENHSADVIILMTIDLKENRMTLVNIPRDIITDVIVYSPAGGYTGIEKLPVAMSYAYGDGEHSSCINTLDAVRKMFYNIPVNSYLSLKIEGISVINDSVGGVDVKCPEDLYDSVTGEIVMSKGEEYHLEGDDARFFVMTRRHDTAEANLLRNERQKIFLSSFIDKTISLSKSDLTTPLRLYDDAEPYSCTNISANRVTYLASELLGRDDIDVQTKTLPVDVKQVENHAENYLKEKEFYELFLSVFYTEVDG